MATRSTTHILKNSDIVNRPLPASLLKGEPIVNTADGIMLFSGVTLSTSEWTPAGTGTTSNFFEVGSNLYDLRLRNKITHYNDLTNLTGKFLSGTTNGFELANISDISGVDTFVTGFTYDDVNTFTISRNQGLPDLTSTISVLSGITYYGDGTGLTNIPISGVVNLQTELDSKVENGVNSGGGEEIFSGKSGTDVYFRTLSGGSNTTISTIGDIVRVDVSIPASTNTFVTGGTYSDVTDTITLTRNDAVTVDITGVSNTFTTGGTYNVGTTSIDFDKNDGTTYSVDLSNIDVNDTFVTGFTYNSSSNTFTISRNEGEPDLTASIDTVSGLTISNLTAGRVVYVGAGGVLTDETGFTYYASTNTFSVPSDGTVNVGTGGLNVGGDAIIQGSLTVFGPSISAFTSELYVEDPNIILNYNPTGNSITTSVGAGWTIQDGNGIVSGDVNLDIIRLQNLTGLTATQVPNVSEYSGGTTGYINRGWITQLNDIVIRSTDVSDGGSLGDINGVRVLGEFDTLDGGNY